MLGGVSAGSLCWHVGGTTDSFGTTLRPVTNGLALIPHSNGVHYDSEDQRRPLYHRLVSDGTLPTPQPLFVGMVSGVAVVLVALTFLPTLALGPLAEGVHR